MSPPVFFKFFPDELCHERGANIPYVEVYFLSRRHFCSETSSLVQVTRPPLVTDLFL